MFLEAVCDGSASLSHVGQCAVLTRDVVDHSCSVFRCSGIFHSSQDVPEGLVLTEACPDV